MPEEHVRRLLTELKSLGPSLSNGGEFGDGLSSGAARVLEILRDVGSCTVPHLARARASSSLWILRPCKPLGMFQKRGLRFIFVSLEHLIGLKLKAWRYKDRLHINHLLDSGVAFDEAKLSTILEPHHLLQRWKQLLAERTES